ncbi:MAG: TraB/GumN family protein, partial [Myxococcota bacterium]|nr:TraB/GumN family protein [Myxococcota bacterium]
WVAMNVGILRFKEQGLSSDDGIDKHFLDRSHAAGKTVLELESVQAQLAMLDSLPANVQEMMLLDALEGGLQSGGDIQRVLAAWKEGNAEEIEKVAFAELNGTPALAPLKEALFTKRNVAMANKIDTMAAPGKSLFVVIGAGHVVGSQGVPALLAGKGYAIRQLDKGAEPRVERP